MLSQHKNIAIVLGCFTITIFFGCAKEGSKQDTNTPAGGIGQKSATSSGLDSDATKTPESTRDSNFDEPTSSDNAAAKKRATDKGKNDSAGVDSKHGTLMGVISFSGDIPKARTIQATKDPAICKKGEGDVQDVVVKDGKLAGVVVELTVPRSVKLETEWDKPKDGYVIRQKNCRFSPRMLVVPTGEELAVYNDDTVQHNINAETFNVLQDPSEEPIKTKMQYTGVSFVRVTCNIHGWMETWVYVARTPLHAVSGSDGKFSVKGIPPGKYRGLATHPTLGKQRFTVEIKAGESVVKDFEFTSK